MVGQVLQSLWLEIEGEGRILRTSNWPSQVVMPFVHYDSSHLKCKGFGRKEKRLPL